MAGPQRGLAGWPPALTSIGDATRVIEALMFFALGFLVAGLIALLIIPAVNARAERLARRRLEALFPLSISELTAEKDHLRAEFAVLQRRLERKAEDALANKHQDMGELGRRAVRIETLEGEISARDHRIGELEGDLERARAQLAATETDLLAARQALAASRETQAALETAHRRTLEEFGATRGQLEVANASLAETRTSLAGTQERLARLESEFADLERREGGILGELDAKRITISDLETRLGTQTSRGDELEHALFERRTELSDERKRVAELAQSLVAEQARAATLEERIRVLGAEHETRAAEWAKGAAAASDLRVERNGLQAQADEHRNAFDLAVSKLAAAEVRIAELEQSQSQKTDGASDQSLADTAELRQRIEEVAEKIMRASETSAAEPVTPARSTG